MRLKENQTNYHASSVRRRLERQDKPPERMPRHRAKKDRRRWCGGHEGRAHKPKCVDYGETKGAWWARGSVSGSNRWKLLVCTECGKELDWYMPWREPPDPPPDWAKEASPT